MNQHLSYYRQRLRLRKRDEVVVEKILDLINLGGAGLIFGQFIGEGIFNVFVLFIGIMMVIVVYLYFWYYLSRFN